MKVIVRVLFSLFFAIAIGVHIYYVVAPDGKPLWWHGIYYLTYGGCWWMLLSKRKERLLWYSLLAIFPFVTHVYYGYKHFTVMDGMFWICGIVCLFLLLGARWIKYEATGSPVA